jgi:hypothetical protein
MRIALMVGSFQRFKEEGDFTYWIRLPKCVGLKNWKPDPILTFLAIR